MLQVLNIYTDFEPNSKSLAKPIVEKTKPTLLKALEDAKLSPQQVDKIILRRYDKNALVQHFTNKSLEKAPKRGLDPMECVAIGAAIQAGVITGEVKDLLLTTLLLFH